MSNPLFQGSQKTTILPTPYQTLLEWNVSANPIYIGAADSGVPTTDDGWFIQKITYDLSANPSAIRSFHNGIWDSRSTYTYY